MNIVRHCQLVPRRAENWLKQWKNWARVPTKPLSPVRHLFTESGLMISPDTETNCRSYRRMCGYHGEMGKEDGKGVRCSERRSREILLPVSCECPIPLYQHIAEQEERDQESRCVQIRS